MKAWRNNRPVNGPVWLLLLCALLLLNGCPKTSADGSSSPGTTARQSQSQTQPAAVSYPAAARDYLLASLRQPTEDGYPPLGPVWQVIARLKHGGDDPEMAELIRQVTGTVEAAGGEPVPELVTAWLAIDPEQATDFIAAKLMDGEEGYLDALAYRPETALALFAEQDPLALSESGRLYLMRMLVAWSPLSAEYTPLLSQLAKAPEPSVRLQAIGMLVALDAADEEQWQELWHAGHDEGGDLEAAVEGIRLSGDGGFAEALVPHAVKVQLGEAAELKRSNEALYAAYALTFLPGEQARLMRGKLLHATDPMIRWAARLGELLHGEPRAWQEAIAAEGVSSQAMLVALQPRQVMHPDLLPTYGQLVEQADPNLRALAAGQLNRYAPYTSNPAVVEIAQGLTTDPQPSVRAAAWNTCAELELPGQADSALAVLADESEPGEVRLAAAAYLMLQADNMCDQEEAP